MSFGADTRNVPSFSSYAEALQRYSVTKPWRGGAHFVRPLEKRSKKTMQIIKYDNEDIVRCRYHHTDLVKFFADGRVEVKAHYSQSSNRFINAIMRRTGYQFVTTQGPMTVWRHSRETGQWYSRGWKVDGEVAVFDAGMTLMNTKPIRVPQLDRVKSREVRERYNYSKFTTWRVAYEAMNPYIQVSRYRPSSWRPDVLPALEVIDMLKAGPASWKLLCNECSNEHIKNQIYHEHPEVVGFKVLDHFASYTEYCNALRLDQKYGWALE